MRSRHRPIGELEPLTIGHAGEVFLARNAAAIYKFKTRPPASTAALAGAEPDCSSTFPPTAARPG